MTNFHGQTLNFGDRTRTGVLNVVWTMTKNPIFKYDRGFFKGCISVNENRLYCILTTCMAHVVKIDFKTFA